MPLDLDFPADASALAAAFAAAARLPDRVVEGLFAEPASAASVAGLLQLAKDGKLARGGTVVCVLTGHGLKDPQSSVGAIVQVEPDADAIAAATR